MRMAGMPGIGKKKVKVRDGAGLVFCLSSDKAAVWPGHSE
jgi:hypothetical protein